MIDMSTIKYGPLRELLRAGGASALDVLHALIDHIDAEDAGNPALEYLKSASAAYENARPETPETRSIEYYRLWSGGQWDTEFIDVPYDTNEEGAELAVQVAASAIDWKDETPVFVGVYHIPELDETCCRCDLPLDGAGDCPDSTCI